MRRAGFGLLLFVTASCQTRAPEQAPAQKTARDAPPSWCSAVESALSGPETRGFHCLEVPNFLLTGFFGPTRNPERSDFVNACFGGDAKSAARLRIDVRPAGSLSFHYSVHQRRSSGGSIDLGFLGPWAPRVRAQSEGSDDVTVNVELQDAEVRVLPSVGEILGQEFQRAEEGSSLRDALSSCIEGLCADGDDAVYTAKVVAAVPVIELRTARAQHHGLGIEAGVTGFEIDTRASSDSKLVIRAKEKLNVAALLETAKPAFERAQTCARTRAAKTRHDVLSGLRELGLQTLASRGLDDIPKLCAPLRSAAKGVEGAFTANEQTAILDGLETIEGAARQLSLPKPNNSLCAVRSLAQVVLSGPSEDNRVHGTVVDVVQPIFDRLTELANTGSLPCAEPIWYLDLDRDGYGDKKKPMRASVQPPGHVANALDCYDANPEAHPGQTQFFSQHRGDGSFDFDCDGHSTRREEVASAGCREVTIVGIPTRCWADPGWIGSVPDCGQQAKWLAECDVSALSCGPVREPRTVQECR
jgi:hypothetical protein